MHALNEILMPQLPNTHGNFKYNAFERHLNNAKLLMQTNLSNQKKYVLCRKKILRHVISF